jgi:translocation and assembly module TamB
MASEAPPIGYEEAAPEPRRRLSVGQKVGIGIGALIALVLLLVAGVYFGLNTELGRRFVVRQIDQLEFASGLDIDVGRIEGNIYGDLTIHQIVVKDPRGA